MAEIPLRDPSRPSGPPLPPMAPADELAMLGRCLHREGYDDHINGHLSWRQPDGTFLVDPRGISWDLLVGEDMVTVDQDGTIIAGRWGITPALALHWEIHRRRPDVAVVVHQHSRFGTVWAAAGRIPPIYDQTSALLEGGLGMYSGYDGSVAIPEAARRAADAIGDAGCALLGQHGVVVTGRNPGHAFQRAVLLEWRCRMAWHVEALGEKPEPLADHVVAELESIYAGKDVPELFAAMAHRLLVGSPISGGVR